MLAPIPLDAPVITATCPVSFLVLIMVFVRCLLFVISSKPHSAGRVPGACQDYEFGGYPLLMRSRVGEANVLLRLGTQRTCVVYHLCVVSNAIELCNAH